MTGEHTVGPVHITSTSDGSPAARSSRYDVGRVPMYSVGTSVRCDVGSPRAEGVEQPVGELGLLDREAGTVRDVVECENDPLHPGVE